jgi:exopolysaccharide biosynthesis WecB/TagA/CpsF family protein
VVLIGGTAEQSRHLASSFGLQHLRHYNPPMGFIRDPSAVEACLQFIEAQSPFRFCLLAVGCPQQEILANALKTRGRARGLALCIGASINYLTGVERRAPLWAQRLGLEWLFRLTHDPARLARRYLVRGPRIFLLLPRLQFSLRRPAAGANLSTALPSEQHAKPNCPTR